jgi:hypothetical protein
MHEEAVPIDDRSTQMEKREIVVGGLEADVSALQGQTSTTAHLWESGSFQEGFALANDSNWLQVDATNAYLTAKVLEEARHLVDRVVEVCLGSLASCCWCIPVNLPSSFTAFHRCTQFKKIAVDRFHTRTL